jgi:hypothetical protein
MLFANCVPRPATRTKLGFTRGSTVRLVYCLDTISQFLVVCRRLPIHRILIISIALASVKIKATVNISATYWKFHVYKCVEGVCLMGCEA